MKVAVTDGFRSFGNSLMMIDPCATKRVNLMLRSIQSGSRPRGTNIRSGYKRQATGLTQWKANKHPVTRSADYSLHAAERRYALPFWMFQNLWTYNTIGNTLTVSLEVENVIKGSSNLVSQFWIQRANVSSQLCSCYLTMVRILVGSRTHCVIDLELLLLTFNTNGSHWKVRDLHQRQLYRKIPYHQELFVVPQCARDY